MKKINKLFIGRLEDIDVWTCGDEDIAYNLDKDEYILILMLGLKKYSLDGTMQLATQLVHKGLAKIEDVKEVPDLEEYVAMLIQQYANPYTTVFVLDNCVDTSRLKVENRVRKAQYIKTKENSAFSVMQQSIPDEGFANIEEERKRKQREEEQRRQEQRRQEQLKQEQRRQEEQQKEKTPRFGTGKQEQAKQKETRADIERVIFMQGDHTFVDLESHSELDDAKAKMVALLEDNVRKRINELIKKFKISVPDDDIYIELISLIVSSNDFDDFTEGWNTSEPNYPLDGFGKSEYAKLYEEAIKYAEVCYALYAN